LKKTEKCEFTAGNTERNTVFVMVEEKAIVLYNNKVYI